ncbi:MAG: hypothetical protein NTW86_02660 [Candidatus Sumerlaeota bacterium]|nr:hypothetical protein [Candidatus Sumerlaeota bacterium]
MKHPSNGAMRRSLRIFWGLAALSLLAPRIMAQPAGAKPVVWMGPPAAQDGKCFRELFEHPDEWKETRALADALFYTDLNFTKQFKDDELKQWFAMMKQWGLKLGMEVGAVKPWGVTGEAVFAKERPMWERIERLGGDIYAVAMDEPLKCCRMDIKKPDAYAVQETANYIALVRKNFPRIQIGDIETYPSIPLADHYWWIDALSKRLAEMKVRGLDFYRLDVNWAVFVVRNEGSWKEVRELERHCREKNLPFSLIYWASGYPALQRKGIADDAAWYVSIMQQGYDYALVDGAPDQYVIESWVGAPSRSVPETADFTFTRSVRDFVRTFVTKEHIAPQAPPLPPKKKTGVPPKTTPASQTPGKRPPDTREQPRSAPAQPAR